MTRFAALLCLCLLLLSACGCHSFQPPRTTTTTTSSSGSRTRSNSNALWPSRSSTKTTSTSRSRTATTATTCLQAAPAAASSLLAAASSPAGAFVVLTSIIVVHEAGHYLAARYYGVKVEEFAIGFGPKVFGFEALGNEFNFRAFPLGGYVRFPENYNITQYQQQEAAAREARREERQRKTDGRDVSVEVDNREASSNKKKKPIGFQLINALTLGAMSRTELQKEAKALAASQKAEKKGDSFFSNLFGNQNSNSKPPDTKAVVLDTSSSNKMEIEFYDDPDLLQNRPWFQRMVVLSGGVIFNLLLAFGIYFGEITTTGLPQPVFDQGIIVSQNPLRDAPANGILRKGDVVVGINGQRLSMSERPTAAASQKAISDLISTIRATPDGSDLTLSVLRGNNRASSNNPQQRQPLEVTIAPKRKADDNKAPPSIGVMLSPNFVKMETLKVDKPQDAILPAARLVSSNTRETAQGLLKFFGQLIMGQDTGGQQVSGPIGLLKTGSDVVSTKDWSTVLAFAAAISINLGVVNALPLPALDGGQLVFVLAEAVTGRKIDQRLQEEIIGITVLLLLFVSVNAALGDVQNLIMKK